MNKKSEKMSSTMRRIGEEKDLRGMEAEVGEEDGEADVEEDLSRGDIESVEYVVWAFSEALEDMVLVV